MTPSPYPVSLLQSPAETPMATDHIVGVDGVTYTAKNYTLATLVGAIGMAYGSIFGAVGDGVTNDSAALSSWAATSGIKALANGDYYAPDAVSGFGRPTIFIADNAKESGTELPFISIGSVALKNAPKNHVFIQQDTSDRSDSTTVQIQRIVDTDDGHTNPKALRVYTQKNHSNDSAEYAISGELDNYSNTSSAGDTAVSGTSNKYGLGSVFAGHFQSNDYNKYTLATDVTPTVGTEMNIQAVGLDHPTANDGYGNRRVLDVLPRTNTSVSGWDTATGNYGAGEIGVGIIIRTDELTDGYFRYGLVIDDVSQASNANNIGVGALINTSGAKGLYIAGALNTTAAISLDTGAWITMSDDDTKKVRYNAGTDGFEFWSGASLRAHIQLNASPALFIANVKVIGARDTGWAAMTGSTNKATVYDTASVTTAQLAGRVMAMQAALTTHGILGT